jgi:hypothetical protein
LEIARDLLDLAKASHHFAASVENRRVPSFARDDFCPCTKQWVLRFHALREPRRAITFRALSST